MQPHTYQGLDLADIPMGFFPDDAVAAPGRTQPAAKPAVFADGEPQKAVRVIPSRAVRLVRAKSGETELRLLALEDGQDVSYVIVSATLAPYKEKRELLVQKDDKQTHLNFQQAVDEFDRRVALAYPPEKLRHGPTVDIHINLI